VVVVVVEVEVFEVEVVAEVVVGSTENLKVHPRMSLVRKYSFFLTFIRNSFEN
jgi:hypothetical protein